MLIAGATEAGAQNTSSVSSPVVTEDRKEISYRLGWTPGESGSGDRYVHRFDYGFALNARSSLKLNARWEDQPGSDLRFDNINAELLFELTPETATFWQSGVRFDGRISDGPDSERIAVHWLNRWNFDNGIQLRAQLIARRAFGGNADDAIVFEGRSSASTRIGDGYGFALLGFFDLGSSEDFGPGGQDSQIGPTLSGPLGRSGWTWTAGNLFGTSGDAPDNDVRLWLSREF